MFINKLKKLAVASLLMMLPVFVLAQAPGKAAYLAGKKLYKERQYEEAAKKFAEAGELNKLDFLYKFWEGFAYTKVYSKDKNEATFTKAVTALEASVKLNENYTAAYQMLARLYTKKDPNKAVFYANKAYEKESDPNKKLDFKLLAVKINLYSKNPQAARREMDIAKSQAPQDLRVLFADADVYAASEQWEQAMQKYKDGFAKPEASTLSANQKARYMLGMGVSQFKANDKSGYEKTLAELTSINANYARLLKARVSASAAGKHLALATGYFKAMDYRQANVHLQDAIKAGDKNNTAYRLAGLISLKTGKFAEASSNFQKAAEFESDPNKKAGLYSQMINIQFTNGDFTGAIATANKILEKTPESASILFMKGQAQYQLQQYRPAMQTLKAAQAALQKNPKASATDKGKYAFMHGLAAKKANDNAEALTSFKEAQAVSVFKAAASSEIKSLASGGN